MNDNSPERKVVVRPGKTPNNNFSRKLVYTGDLADYIFSKKFQKMPLPIGWNTKDVQLEYEPYNKYTLNSYDYRGPELGGDVDFLTAGCSVTFGIGVPDDGVWPEFMSKQLDASYVNIGMSGASIEWIVQSIFRYIHTFGKPKRGIMALMPNYTRIDLIINKEINSCEQTGPIDFLPQYYNDDRRMRLISHHQFGDEPPKLIKRPYPVEYTSINEEALKQAIRSLKDLEIFCEQADIPLIWSTWSDQTADLAINLPDQYKFNNFMWLNGLNNWKSHIYELEKTDEDPEGIVDYKRLYHSDETMHLYGCSDELNDQEKCICFTDCHFELADKYPLSFHLGTDRFKYPGQAHMGVHRQIHIGEDFADKARRMGI